MGRFSKLEWEPDKNSKIPDPLLKPDEKKDLISDTGKEEDAEIYDYYFYLKKAENFFFTGDFKNSLRQYSRALQMDNSQIDPWVGQVFCLIFLKQLQEADLWISRGLELFPDHPQMLSLRGVIYAHKGMVKRGISTSDFAMTLKTGITPIVWIIRGEILLLGDNKNASFCFEKAIEISNQTDWQTPTMIGMIYYRNKCYTIASHYFQTACSRNLAHYYLWHLLGMSYKKLGIDTKAIEAFKRALELKPDYRESTDAIRSIMTYPVFNKIFLFPFRPFILLAKLVFKKK